MTPTQEMTAPHFWPSLSLTSPAAVSPKAPSTIVTSPLLCLRLYRCLCRTAKRSGNSSRKGQLHSNDLQRLLWSLRNCAYL